MISKRLKIFLAVSAAIAAGLLCILAWRPAGVDERNVYTRGTYRVDTFMDGDALVYCYVLRTRWLRRPRGISCVYY